MHGARYGGVEREDMKIHRNYARGRQRSRRLKTVGGCWILNPTLTLEIGTFRGF